MISPGSKSVSIDPPALPCIIRGFTVFAEKGNRGFTRVFADWGRNRVIDYEAGL
jgi:hypothetical protein